MEQLGQDIDMKEHKLTEMQSLHLSTKTANGKLFLDARKWIKYPNLEDYTPSKKGLMLSIDEWKMVLPTIIEMVNCNTKTEDDDKKL